MTEGDTLININLQIQQNKDDLIMVKGFKLYLFEALYLIQQYYGRHKFLDILFTIAEFIQLMGFPMDKVFDESWGNHWVKTIGNFFRYFQLSFFLGGSSFFIIIYIISCVYIIIFISLFFYVLVKSFSNASVQIIKFLVLMFQIQTVLNIPFLRIFFSTFFCENDILDVEPDIKCKSGIHIFLIVISAILIIIYKLIILLFVSTLYEFGVQPNKLKSGYGSSTEVLLNLTKLILIIIYQFISHQMVLAIITLFFSIILLFHFLIMQPYSNGFTMKLYLSLYSIFCWSCIICIVSILLKNSNFRSGIILLILGYPLILISIFFQDLEFSIDKYFSLYLSNARGGYNSLLEIEYFLKLEDSLAEKIKTKEFKLLFSYISDFESKCTDQNCHLKSFMKMQFKTENFEALKILLLQHAELLYKQAISKYPYNIKLRIGFIMFLFKKINKKLRGKNEIILLNKFETNLECSYLIYKVQKYISDNMNDKEEEEIEYNNENSIPQSMYYKEKTKGIKTMIENILNNYVSFWNIMLIHDWNTSENFIKMSHLGEKIKSLNKELNNNIKSLETWNLLDQETIKIYTQYLKEIINNEEKANIFSDKISEEEQNKHQFDDINLFELNYKEMSKNEDYKYIIINFSKDGFNKIYNISFPACKIFGYTKEELIGRSLDILFPQIYNYDLKLFFQKKVEEFKQRLLIKNKKINSDTWTFDSFGLNKTKFLISFKIKWLLTSLDDEKIYGIGNILHDNKKLISDKDQERVYVLTDKNLIIQNFSSNALKMLKINTSVINNNCNITNYVTELNENLINELELRNDKEESNISNTRTKKRNSRRITRYIKSDILKKYNYLGNNNIRVIHWKTGEIGDNNNLKNNKGNNNLNYKFKNENNNNEISSLSIKSSQKGRSSENLIIFDKFKTPINAGSNGRNTAPTPNKGVNFTSIYTVELNKLKNITNDTTTKDKEKENPNLLKQKEQMFNMIVKEAKFIEHKVGYIFIFKPYINKEGEKNKYANDGIKDLSISQENKNMNISEISLISFGEDKKKFNNPQTSFGFNNQNNDSFFLNFCNEKENQFTFDLNNMTYKQFKYNNKEKNSLYEKLKEEAIKKVTNVKKQVQNEETEEEEESSESEYTSEEENSENSLELSKDKKEQLSSKTEPKKVNEEVKENTLSKKSTLSMKKTLSSKNMINNQNSLQNTLKSPPEQHKKKEEEDFYHVNFSKITYYVFNYTTGYVELQKDQNHKISHVTYLINTEKEKQKNSSSRYVANTKFMKGRKKGNINKKEENEIVHYSLTSMKLKEIYRSLSSKDKESSILKMFLYSIFIFVLIVGTGILGIVIYSYLKNTIYSFYILIQKSDNLYKNLLFEITIVKEMLIINSLYYNNTLTQDKAAYYEGLAQMIYQYYRDNAFIISNLTNNFNILNKEDEESIINKQVELFIIDSTKSNQLNYYQYKNYSILIYSAYRELNSALYHISQIKMKDIYQYDEDVYYFTKNGMSNLLISSEKQMWTLTEKFEEKIESGHHIIIICCCAIFAINCLCLFIFIYFYSKVITKKQNYLSVLSELDNNLIISSLQKCEKFSHKLQEKKNNKDIKEKKISLESSSVNISEIDNENSSFLIDKKNKADKILQPMNNKKDNKKKLRKSFLFQIILFLILFAWQFGAYIYYYQIMNIYRQIILYEYYISMYASNFLFIFIGLREYIFDKNFMFYNQTVDEYVNRTLANYYVIFSESAKKKDDYRVVFPESFQIFLNYLQSSKICEFIDIYNQEYPEANKNCSTFFYRSPEFGYFTVLSSFVEELRLLRDKIDNYLVIAESKNFTYNESFLNDPHGIYENYYEQYKDNMEEYKKYNPARLLNTLSHKRLLITYLYINTQVYNSLISESLKQFDELFNKYNSLYLIIDIVFLFVVCLGFIFIWTPFIFGQNKDFLKIKNMLSIIPSELLMDLPDINILLGLEEPMK